jgi:chromosome segregation ATPase
MEMRGSIKTFIVTQAKKAVRFCPSPEGWVQFHDGQRVVCEQEKSVKKTVAQLSGKGEKATTAAPGQPAPTPAESSPPPTAATTSPPPAPSVAQPEPQPPSGTILSEEAAREHKRKLELFESEYNAKQAELTKQFEAELAKLRQEQAMLEQDRIRTATVLKETENLQRERQEHLDALSAQRKKYDVLVLNYNALQRASTALQTDLELEKTRTRGLADQLQRASSGATLPSSVDLALRERLAAIKEEQAIVQTQLQSEKARVLALEKEHLAMADQHAFLKSQNADMSQELYSIRLERDSLCEKIAELESQLAKVELARESDKISERTHFMEAEQGFSSHIKDIVEVSKAKDVQIQELNAQLSQLKSQIAALEQGNADVVSLQSQLKTAHEQNTELRSQMSDLINARSRLQTRDAEIADLNTKLASAEATISALREEVGTQKRKHDEREEDMIALDEELKSSRDKYSKLQVRLEVLTRYIVREWFTLLTRLRSRLKEILNDSAAQSETPKRNVSGCVSYRPSVSVSY